MATIQEAQAEQLRLAREQGGGYIVYPGQGNYMKVAAAPEPPKEELVELEMTRTEGPGTVKVTKSMTREEAEKIIAEQGKQQTHQPKWDPLKEGLKAGFSAAESGQDVGRGMSVDAYGWWREKHPELSAGEVIALERKSERPVESAMFRASQVPGIGTGSIVGDIAGAAVISPLHGKTDVSKNLEIMKRGWKETAIEREYMTTYGKRNELMWGSDGNWGMFQQGGLAIVLTGLGALAGPAVGAVTNPVIGNVASGVVKTGFGTFATVYGYQVSTSSKLDAAFKSEDWRMQARAMSIGGGAAVGLVSGPIVAGSGIKDVAGLHYGKITITEGGVETTKYRGVYAQPFDKEITPLVGYGERKVFIGSLPKLELKEGIVASPLAIEALRRQGALHPSSEIALEESFKITDKYRFKDVKPKSRELSLEHEAFTKEEMKVNIEMEKSLGKDLRYRYGSSTLQEAFDKPTKDILGRPSHDIDEALGITDATDLRQVWASKLTKASGNQFRVSPVEPAVIEKSAGGSWIKALDIHDLTTGLQDAAPEGAWRITYFDQTFKKESVPLMTPGSTLARKGGASIAEIHIVDSKAVLTPQGGLETFYSGLGRGKHPADFIAIAKEMGVDTTKLQAAYVDLGYKQTSGPQASLGIVDLGGKQGISVSAVSGVSASIVSLSSLKSSVSAASLSASPSVSPSPSLSVSPSLSLKTSPSSKPSISPSFSPSLSPSLSASISPSISPSFSPSTSPSFSPSLSLSPSPSPKTSSSSTPGPPPILIPLEGFTKRGSIKFTGYKRKSKYTPSVAGTFGFGKGFKMPKVEMGIRIRKVKI